MRWPPILLALVTIAALVQWAGSRPLERRPGVLAPDDPSQVLIEDAAPIEAGDFVLEPRAEFEATVRILGTETYRLDALAAVAPLDLAVGWGAMSDTAVLERLRISQGARFFLWKSRDAVLPIPRDELESHASNWHLIPADDALARDLRRLRVGEVVHLAGQLVDVQGPKTSARTSLRRDDTGAGACEILRVTSMEIRPGG